MHFSFASGDATRQRADVLVIPLFDNELTDKKKQPKARNCSRSKSHQEAGSIQKTRRSETK